MVVEDEVQTVVGMVSYRLELEADERLAAARNSGKQNWTTRFITPGTPGTPVSRYSGGTNSPHYGCSASIPGTLMLGWSFEE